MSVHAQVCGGQVRHGNTLTLMRFSAPFWTHSEASLGEWKTRPSIAHARHPGVAFSPSKLSYHDMGRLVEVSKMEDWLPFLILTEDLGLDVHSPYRKYVRWLQNSRNALTCSWKPNQRPSHTLYTVTD